jgi:hypothetical protein|tara:strand:+ start:114 stop:461 length:348 start_codon:yes stop_codon:yes gene_type:complete
MANIYLNSKKDLTSNTVTTLYTVPSNSRAILKAILVSSDSGSATTITVDLFAGDPAASAAKFTLFNVEAIGANESKQLLTEPLIMLEGEVLQVTAADANRLFVVASILEINREDK